MPPELPPEKPKEKPPGKPPEDGTEKSPEAQSSEAAAAHSNLPENQTATSPAGSPTEQAIAKPVAEPAISLRSPENAERQMQRVSRRSFAIGGTAATAGLAAWYWLRSCAPEDGIPWPLRRALDFNAGLAQAYFQDSHLAPTYSADRAGEPRVNGRFGLNDAAKVSQWKLHVETPAKNDVRQFDLNQIRSLPRVEMITELKCIEEGFGRKWSAGPVRAFRDFVTAHGLGARDAKAMFDYVYLESIDGGYYVGLDIASAMHPQTLLCYEMNGQPLSAGHGAPLRLVIPVKYGIKNIKQIGKIRFADTRPADYWAERGYDWYAGL